MKGSLITRDDDVARRHAGQHVSQLDCTVDGIELVAAFDEARRRAEVVVGAERDDEHVGVVRPPFRDDAPRCRVDRRISSCRNVTPGLAIVA